MDFVDQSQKMMDNSPMQPICEVCGFSLDGPILNFGSHPLCDDLVQEKSNIEVPRFSQQIKLDLGSTFSILYWDTRCT